MGGGYLNDPDIEFANFTLSELEEIIWKIALENGADKSARASLHSAITGARSGEQLLKKARKAIPELQHLSKSVFWGERLMEFASQNPEFQWWDLGIRQIPNVVWVKSIHDSHRQAFVSFPALVDQRLYEIHHADAKVLTSILNSFSFFLAKELHGRVNLGEGALDTAVYEANQLPVLPSSAFTSTQRQRLFAAFEQMANREIKSIFEELGLPKPNRDYSNIDPNEVSLDKVLPDRRALDEVVFEALGLMEEEQLEVYRAVVELVKTRLSKARSLRRRG